MTSFLLLPPWDFLSLPIVVPLLSYAVKARRWIKIKKKLRKESNSLKHSPAHGSALFINADILFCLFFFLTWSQTSKEKKGGSFKFSNKNCLRRRHDFFINDFVCARLRFVWNVCVSSCRQIYLYFQNSRGTTQHSGDGREKSETIRTRVSKYVMK
jgi:hypothetical protein